MTTLLTLGSRILFTASACVCATFACSGDDSPAASFGERSHSQSTASLAGRARCDDYPIALEPDPNAEARAEEELRDLAPGAKMTWYPARGTFAYVSLGVKLPQCGAEEDVFTQLFALTSAYPHLFQLNLGEWESPSRYPCAQVGADTQVLPIRRARVGSHPISQGLETMFFFVQRVNGVVELRSVMADYLPPATPWFDMKLSACRDLDNELARQLVLDSSLSYSIFDTCYYIGSGAYSPNGLDTIEFDAGASWAWHEDPMSPRTLFTKRSQGRLFLDSRNHTWELVHSDANCPDENGQPKIGFRLTFDTVKTELVVYQPGLDCIVCLR